MKEVIRNATLPTILCVAGVGRSMGNCGVRLGFLVPVSRPARKVERFWVLIFRGMREFGDSRNKHHLQMAQRIEHANGYPTPGTGTLFW